MSGSLQKERNDNDMRTFPFVSILLISLAIVFAAAVEKLQKSTVESIDRPNLRITLRLPDRQTRVLQISSESRFLINNHYAINTDVEVGDTVSGTIKKRPDGVYEAVRLYVVKAKKAPGIVLSPVN